MKQISPHAMYLSVKNRFLMKPENLYFVIIQRRKQLVDWISGIGESLSIQALTIHHCVIIMDFYTSLVNSLPVCDLQLIAICCLMISTKYLEMKYPSAESLNSATQNKYCYKQIIAQEGIILGVIGWDLMRYSTLDYLNFFLNQGCLFDNDELLVRTQSLHNKP